MNSYRFVGVDGQIYGPYSIEQIRQYIAENRITPQSQISKDGGPWQIVGSLPELSGATIPPVAAPAYAPHYSQAQLPKSVSSSKGLISSGYICMGVSLLCCPPLFALAALIIGIINCAKGETGHGIAQIIGSLVCGGIGMVLSAIINEAAGLGF